MDQEDIKLIFGLKVRQMRTNKELSLFKLGKLTGLSKSYLNEIEKGKKYPKTDKILALAEVFEVSYDDLVSLKLDKNLAPIADILKSNILKEIPLELFGIEERDLIEIIANAPAKVNAFISTLIEIGNNYNLTRESFFLAALRSLQEANDNYFPEIEKSVKSFIKAYHVREDDEMDDEWMSEILEEEYGYKIINTDFSSFKQKELNSLRSIYIETKKELYINTSTYRDQRKFILAKELGHNFLELKERLYTFSWARFDSFEALLNNFYASYFAGALLLPEEDMVADLTTIFNEENHDLNKFSEVFTKYTESPETIYQRLTNLLPKYFNIKDLFFLRVAHKIGSASFRLTKELHLNQHQSPQANETEEHYCRRWVSIRTLQILEEDLAQKHVIDAQLSIYPFSGNQKYYVVSSATKDPFNPTYLRSVCIGVLVPSAKKKINFLNDEETILTKEVAGTCENCGIMDCKERVAQPIRFERDLRDKDLNEAINAFIRKKEKE